ncbi:hypothetical protein ACH5RR_024270 [Cinchona calisaya]|uniref:RING-type domain-containing protein n=1 Tax=Cinchona calisaya TaxID=153742 RepID=A0ABD2YXA6_9GENT
MAERWVSEETVLILKRKMRAISVLAGLPILCILNNFHQYSFKGGATTSIDDDNDANNATTTSGSGEGEHIKEEDDDNQNHQLQCVICLYNVCKGEKYRILRECSHGFHVDCIDAWLMQNSTCPLCRSSVAYTPAGKQQPQLISNEDEDQEAFYETVIASFLSFLDHLWTWFLNPLGFDRSCQDYHAFV